MDSNTIVIIGNGIAGITAAREARKRSDRRIVVISAESDHFFSRTALMYIYMGHMSYEETKPYEDGFWKKNRIELVRGHVARIDPARREVIFKDGRTALPYGDCLVATGSESNFFDWPGRSLSGVQALYSLQDLELMEANTRGIESAVVIGGGLIGVEMAEMLHSRGIHVTFLVREKGFAAHFLPCEEASMVSRHIRSRGIDLRLESGLKDILGDANGRVRAVGTESGEEIRCQFVGITVGVRPDVRLAKVSGLEVNRGVLVDEFLRTSAPNIFAAGDCTELRAPRTGRRATEPIWYTGRMQGETAARNICGENSNSSVAYDPGIWFNSAKFFDIEYQVYGDIRPELPAEQASIYWEDASGEKSIRINYERADERVVGFNLMGVRYRHEVCEAWIASGATIADVIRDLHRANFDPEFFKRNEKAVAEKFHSAARARTAQ